MTDVRNRTVDLPGVTLAYRESGRPDGPPLVLLHALGERAADWDTVLPDLAPAHRVFALDLRGHGDSARTAAYSLEAMRDDVLSFLDALGLARVDLVGHSMGGAVAHLLAEAAPERVDRLVLEEIPALYPRPVSVLPEDPAQDVHFDWAMVRAVKAQFDAPDPAWRAGLARITARTLAVAGGPASPVPQERIAELARLIPDCRLVTVEAGHLVHGARPAEFVAAVAPFLGRV
ncbi:alpha/beta fold hydrolase [Kitasatospora sp. NPDC101235]|uniref:alpha/beta fold hydrolase n=1 Tax=Kitasatospora sp. NPDC101235 TaxID=3364101 RepID=UPI0038263F77